MKESHGRRTPENGSFHGSRSRQRSRSRGRGWVPTHLEGQPSERHHSALSVHSHEGPRNKNIPMVWEQPGPYTKGGSDVSPLMMIRDQYNIKRPPFGSGIERNIEPLAGPGAAHLTAPSKTVGSTPASKKLESSLSLKYHSEPDDDSDDNHDQQTEVWEGVEGFVDNNFLNVPPPEKQNINEILLEIDNFQSKFVQKYNAYAPNGYEKTRTPTSRVQQKVLDYKDLMSTDNDDFNSSHSYLSLTSINNDASSSFAYAIKKQHEMISSHYTLIRLRFPSLRKSGVLGYISRQVKPVANLEPRVDVVKLQQARAFLQSTWDEELQTLEITKR